MNQQAVWTIGKVLEWTQGFFQKKNIETARLDAELLIGHALKLERIGLYLEHHKPLKPEELATIRSLVKRRAAYEPIHYILGYREFWSVRLHVDPRVLIPRPDTERVVEVALSILHKNHTTILDLCTGSGAIALALAKEREDVHITATDLSTDALAVAQSNALALSLSNIRFSESDLFDTIEDTFDLIVSNPPYIVRESLGELMPDVRDFEPMMALDGGEDGLSFYRKIISDAPNYLRTEGHILLEIGHDQADAVRTLIEDCTQLHLVGCFKDIAGNDRVIHAIKT